MDGETEMKAQFKTTVKNVRMFLEHILLCSDMHPGQCMDDVVRNASAICTVLKFVDGHNSTHEPSNTRDGLIVAIRPTSCGGKEAKESITRVRMG
jgi:hypothetical protein